MSIECFLAKLQGEIARLSRERGGLRGRGV